MGDMPRTPSTKPDSLPLRRRFVGIIDEDGEPTVRWEMDTRDEWVEQWPPCPDGGRIELRYALGFRERNIGELELRVLLGGGDGGVCQTIVDERDDEVYVRVLVHRADEHQGFARDDREYTDCPVRTSLVRPLSNRAVIDMDSDEELLLYTPLYLNNVRQPDHGYRAAARRRRSPGVDTARGSAQRTTPPPAPA